MVSFLHNVFRASRMIRTYLSIMTEGMVHAARLQVWASTGQGVGHGHTREGGGRRGHVIVLRQVVFVCGVMWRVSEELPLRILKFDFIFPHVWIWSGKSSSSNIFSGGPPRLPSPSFPSPFPHPSPPPPRARPPARRHLHRPLFCFILL